MIISGNYMHNTYSSFAEKHSIILCVLYIYIYSNISYFQNGLNT